MDIACGSNNREAKRRYRQDMTLAMSLYVLVLVGSVYWLKHGLTGPASYIIAFLPTLPCLLVPRAMIRFFATMDELQRRIQFEAMAFAFTLTAVLTLSYGFLQNAGVPALNWVWVWPLMGILWGIGMVIARRRYR